MTFLELFTLFASAVTIFGLIVGVFSVYNGRMIRREITAVIRETHEATRQILQGITAILARIDERVR